MATTFKDYYETLGVKRDAGEKEIKAAFRRLARKHHPDVNAGDPTAVERFKEINEAHEVLGDPEKRRRYDQLGPQWEQYEQWERAGKPGGGSAFTGAPPFGGGSAGQVEYHTVSSDELESLFGSAESPFSDFFHTVFGRGAAAGPRRGQRRAVAPRRGGDVEGEVTISLAEAYSGADRTVELTGESGLRRVQVHIPAGIAEGARVRAAGQGGSGRAGGTAGDLLIRVRVAPDPRFVRDGQDLRTSIPVPLATALLGGTVDVITPPGRRIELRIPPETQNGAKFRLRGLGMPHVRGSGRGDLYAEVDVRLPLPLSEAARTAAEQLR
ncbi:MAG: DnaJ C-terminal domain-containing protein [Candidatus Dormibacteria bacterium]